MTTAAARVAIVSVASALATLARCMAVVRPTSLPGNPYSSSRIVDKIASTIMAGWRGVELGDEAVRPPTAGQAYISQEFAVFGDEVVDSGALERR